MLNALSQRWPLLFAPAALAATLCYLIVLGHAPDVAVPVAVMGGETVLTLSAAQQRAAGIATVAPAPGAGQPRMPMNATVIDLRPLMLLHDRWQHLQPAAAPAANPPAAPSPATPAAAAPPAPAAPSAAGAVANPAAAGATAVNPASAGTAAAQPATDAARQAFQSAARLQFGAPLARWLTTPSTRSQQLWSGEAALLAVALPADLARKPPARLDIPAGPDARLPALLITAAALPGTIRPANVQWYFVQAALAPNSRIIAQLPATDPAAATQFIPAAAIVWVNNQPWAWATPDGRHFVRRPVSQRSPWNGGYFVPADFLAGDRLIVRGADWLLATERQFAGAVPSAQGLPAVIQ